MNSPTLAIGIVTVANLPQGTGRTGRLRTLVGALASLGHRVRIWNEHSIERTGSQEVSGSLSGGHYEYVLGTTERKWGFGSIPLKLRAVTNIQRRILLARKQEDLDLVLFNHLAFYDTFPLTRLAMRLKIPTIQCYEDERRELVGKASLSQKVFGLNSWLADHWCSRMADQIWVISSYLREKYSRLSEKPHVVHTIPTIIDCAAWSLPPEPSQATPVLLYSGSFTEQDDIEKLALVLQSLKSQNVAFKARFLGGDPGNLRVQRLKDLVKSGPLAGSVEILGFQSAEVVKKEISNSNILLNLRANSLWGRSGLSTKLSEYLASGRTVLTTNIGDNAFYVRHGESAIVVDPDDPPDRIASELKYALEHPEFRRKLSEGAHRAALAHFDVPVVQKQIAAALEQLLISKSLETAHHTT